MEYNTTSYYEKEKRLDAMLKMPCVEVRVGGIVVLHVSDLSFITMLKEISHRLITHIVVVQVKAYFRIPIIPNVVD